MLISYGCSWIYLEVGEFLRVYGEGDCKRRWQVMMNLNRVALDNLLEGTGV